MKRIVLTAILAAFCTTGWAQEKPAAAKPKAEAKPAAAEKVASDKKSRRNEDARECLGKPSNSEIIKCAEAYL